MKKRMGLVLAALLLLLASGCGEADSAGKEDAGTSEVSMTAVYAGMEEACGWTGDYMTDVEGEMLESYYPGLCEIPAKQLVAKVPAMSSDVNEIVLLQCESETDMERAAAILEARIDSQVEGGAWYAETLEAWEKAAVLRQGTCAALIASGEFQELLEEQFNQQFT